MAPQIDLTGVNAFLIATFIASSIGNTLVLVIRLRKEKWANLKPYEILICHLAATDLLFAVYIPIMVHTNIKGKWVLGEAACKISSAWSSIAVHVSVLNVVIMGFERYRSLCSPLAYKWSHKKIAAILMATWLSSTAFFIPQFIVLRVDWWCAPVFKSLALEITYVILQFLLIYMLPVIVIMVLNVKVILVLRRRASSVSVQRAMPLTSRSGTDAEPATAESYNNNTQASGDSSDPRDVSLEACTHGVSFSKQYKSVFKILTALTLTHMLVGLPNHIFYLWRLSGGDRSSPTLRFAMNVVGYMIFLNSCVNPLIYSILDKRFRGELIELLKTCCKKNARPLNVI